MLDGKDGLEGRPVLILHGAQDRRFPPAEMQPHWRSVRGRSHPEEVATDIDIVVIPGRDHFALLEDPDALLAPLVEWMRRH